MPSTAPGILVILDKERELRLDIETLFLAELEMGRLYGRKVSLIRVMIDPEGLSLNDLAILLWAGCRHQDATLSLEQVREAMTFGRVPGYLEAVYAAWNRDNAPAEPSEEVVNGPFPTSFPGNDTGALPVSSLASVSGSSGA